MHLRFDMKKFNEEDIVTYENFFDPQDFKEISSYLSRPMWKWGHGSLPDGHPDKPESVTPFWKMELTQDEFFSNYLFDVIKKKTNQDYLLTRCYCNGHTFGSSGNFHIDWKDETGRTVLLYANETWKQEWGGKTVYDIDGKYHYTEFVPNSIVIFPGIIPHRSEITSRIFTGLRKTVAWKLVLLPMN